MLLSQWCCIYQTQHWMIPCKWDFSLADSIDKLPRHWCFAFQNQSTGNCFGECGRSFLFFSFMEYLFCFCFLVSFLVLFFLSIKKLTEHHTVASAHRSQNDEVRLCFLIFMIDIILSAMCIAIDQVYIEIYIDIKILPALVWPLSMFTAKTFVADAQIQSMGYGFYQWGYKEFIQQNKSHDHT